MTEIPDHLLKRAASAAAKVREPAGKPWPVTEVRDFNRNAFSIYREDFSKLAPYQPRDNPFRNYTPFPKLDAAERKARAAAIEGRERLVAAWKVLRSGNRDPFDEGCDCW